MKKVLMISYAYPPVATIASLRSGKMAKYLPDFGWEPVVLTAASQTPQIGPRDELKYGSIIRTNDFYLYEEMEKITKRIKQIFCFKRFMNRKNGKRSSTIQKRAFERDRHLAIRELYFNILVNIAAFPDPTNGWYFIVRKNHRELLRNMNIDLVFSTSGPFTSHLIANFLALKFRVPWVADFRDLWTQGYVFKRWFPFNLLERKLETHTIRKCDIITTVSHDFANKLSEIHKKDIGVVMNGFDEEDYSISSFQKNDRLTFVYTGNIYEDKQDPVPFFAAIKTIVANGIIGENEISVDFYGRKHAWIEKIVNDMRISHIVRFHGYIPFRECIRKQANADTLLMLHSKSANEKAWIPAKLFEYMGARRPIISVGCGEGPVGKILSETGAGSAINETGKIVEALTESVSCWKTGGYLKYHGKTASISKYTRKAQTGILAGIFDRLLYVKDKRKASHSGFHMA